MEAHEAVHLARFDSLLTEYRVRPTAFAPLWRLAGFALGAGTALLGEKAAHACTEAVETVIEAHYADQIDELAEREPALAAELSQFRNEELAHRDQAVNEGAHEAPGYALLAAVIRTGCRTAIRISEKI
jgi:ubiquinone biosynthesis monooxygenase Coq7